MLQPAPDERGTRRVERTRRQRRGDRRGRADGCQRSALCRRRQQLEARAAALGAGACADTVVEPLAAGSACTPPRYAHKAAADGDDPASAFLSAHRTKEVTARALLLAQRRRRLAVRPGSLVLVRGSAASRLGSRRLCRRPPSLYVLMAAGLAAQRLGAESPLHFGVAPQSTAQCPSPPSRPVSFRLESLRVRAVSCRCASRSVRCSLHPISPWHASIRIAHCRAASSALRVALAEAGAPPSRPAAGPTHGMRRAPAAAHMRDGPADSGVAIEGASVAAAVWRGQARRSEGQGCCARCEIRWYLAATADVQRADCALKSGR
jgi:hypothetical protein